MRDQGVTVLLSPTSWRRPSGSPTGSPCSGTVAWSRRHPAGIVARADPEQRFRFRPRSSSTTGCSRACPSPRIDGPVDSVGPSACPAVRRNASCPNGIVARDLRIDQATLDYAHLPADRRPRRHKPHVRTSISSGPTAVPRARPGCASPFQPAPSLPGVAECRPPGRSIGLDRHSGRRRPGVEQRQVVRLPLLREEAQPVAQDDREEQQISARRRGPAPAANAAGRRCHGPGARARVSP